MGFPCQLIVKLPALVEEDGKDDTLLAAFVTLPVWFYQMRDAVLRIYAAEELAGQQR